MNFRLEYLVELMIPLTFPLKEGPERINYGTSYLTHEVKSWHSLKRSV